MKQTIKQKMNQQIKQHGESLIKFFSLPQDTDPVKLCKALRRIENKAHHAITCLWNTNTLNYLDHPKAWELVQASEEYRDKFFAGIERRLARVIGKENMEKVFINHDPRGYALKIKDVYAKDFPFKDWGGYGILAPEFTGSN